VIDEIIARIRQGRAVRAKPQLAGWFVAGDEGLGGKANPQR